VTAPRGGSREYHQNTASPNRAGGGKGGWRYEGLTSPPLRRKDWTAERTLTATQSKAVAAVTTLKHPHTMRSGSLGARRRRPRGVSPPLPLPPPVGGGSCSEGPGAEDDASSLAMADELGLGGLPSRGFGFDASMRWRGGEPMAE
jgi:hypothetical protein